VRYAVCLNTMYLTQSAHQSWWQGWNGGWASEVGLVEHNIGGGSNFYGLD